MFRSLKPYQHAIDATIAAVALGLGLLLYLPSGPLVALTVTGMAATLVFRRWSPALALGIAWATVALQLSTGGQPNPSNVAVLPVLYATAAYGSRLVRWLGFASAFLGALVATAYLVVLPAIIPALRQVVGGLDPAGASGLPAHGVTVLVMFFSCLALFLLAWTLGLLADAWRTAARNRRERELSEQQQRLAEHTVLVEQERNRIARDMHDVVAHSLAVVIAQADGARYAHASGLPRSAATEDPTDAALTTISATARDALADVRLLLGQLRHRESPGPQPTLDDVGTLIDQLRAAGQRIDDRSTGFPRPLGQARQLAVYRIVQEALTNALRHGDATEQVQALFDWSEGGVQVTISNLMRADVDGQQRTAAIPLGHGLPGMRERAELVGGWFSARVIDGWFQISAFIPVGAAARPSDGSVIEARA